jgi:hypothetical protein
MNAGQVYLQLRPEAENDISFDDGQSGTQMMTRELPKWLGKVIRYKR